MTEEAHTRGSGMQLARNNRHEQKEGHNHRDVDKAKHQKDEDHKQSAKKKKGQVDSPQPSLVRSWNWYSGQRVGEAANPGPTRQKETNVVCVLNPAALHGKLHEILRIPADVYCIAETSCTGYAQKIFQKEAKPYGYTCHWSAPTLNRKETTDDRVRLSHAHLAPILPRDHFNNFPFRTPHSSHPKPRKAFSQHFSHP